MATIIRTAMHQLMLALMLLRHMTAQTLAETRSPTTALETPLASLQQKLFAKLLMLNAQNP